MGCGVIQHHYDHCIRGLPPRRYREVVAAGRQVAESIELQRQAVDRFKTVSRIAIPGIVLCVVLIVYLIARYL